MIALTLLSVALTLLALGLQLNPEVHNATVSWVLIGAAVFLILVSGAMALAGRGPTSNTARAPMSPDTREFVQRMIFMVVFSLLPILTAILFSKFVRH